jgi:hypothetical protein
MFCRVNGSEVQTDGVIVEDVLKVEPVTCVTSIRPSYANVVSRRDVSQHCADDDKSCFGKQILFIKLLRASFYSNICYLVVQ